MRCIALASLLVVSVASVAMSACSAPEDGAGDAPAAGRDVEGAHPGGPATGGGAAGSNGGSSGGDSGAGSPGASAFAITFAGAPVVHAGEVRGVALTVSPPQGTPLDITAIPLPAGITAASLRLPPGATKGTLMLTASASPALGPATLDVRASDGTSTATSPLRLLVAGAPGTLDTSFGQGGTVSVSGSDYTECFLLAPDASGGIFDQNCEVGRTTHHSSAGSVDAAFGSGGSVDGSLQARSSKVVWIGDSGGLVRSVRAVDASTGALATSWFGGSGVFSPPTPFGAARNASGETVTYTATTLALASGGAIVASVAERYVRDAAPTVLRTDFKVYDAAGTEVRAFVRDGRWSPRAEGPLPGQFTATDGSATLYQFDGSGTVLWSRTNAGGRGAFQESNYLVFGGGARRMLPNGSLDATFVWAGPVNTLDVEVAGDGKILTVSVVGVPNPNQLQRFVRNGGFDTSFGQGGTVNLPFMAGTIIHDAFGRIVVGGQKKIQRYWP